METFKAGRLLEIGPALMSTGGPVSNTGLALHKLGVPVRLMGKVGDDVFGKVILDILTGLDAGLTDGIAVASGEKSSYSIILSLPDRDRMFLHFPGVNNGFSADDIDYQAVGRTQIFHFGYPPAMKRMYENDGADLVEIFRRVKAVGVVSSLDMVMPDPATPAAKADWGLILHNVLPFVDLFLPSIEEMLLLLEPDLFNELSLKAGEQGLLSFLSTKHFSQMAETLLDLGASIVGLKAGYLGVYLRTNGVSNAPSLVNRQEWLHRELWAPCFKVDIAGTTGAGDATIAGFLTGLLHGLSPSKTLSAAVATGACCVNGSRPPPLLSHHADSQRLG